jgi:hypothetical protein
VLRSPSLSPEIRGHMGGCRVRLCWPAAGAAPATVSVRARRCCEIKPGFRRRLAPYRGFLFLVAAERAYHDIRRSLRTLTGLPTSTCNVWMMFSVRKAQYRSTFARRLFSPTSGICNAARRVKRRLLASLAAGSGSAGLSPHALGGGS